jgi:hypothetical protein
VDDKKSISFIFHQALFSIAKKQHIFEHPQANNKNSPLMWFGI